MPKDGTSARAVKKSGGGVVVVPESSQDLAAAIISLYRNPVLTKKLGEKARKFAVEHYSFEQALMAYEAIFDGLIARKLAHILPVIEK